MSLVANELTIGCKIWMKKEGWVLGQERELEYGSERTEMGDRNWREGALMLPRRSGKGFLEFRGQRKFNRVETMGR